MLSILPIFLIVLLVLVLGAGFVCANYFYNLSLNPHYDKTRVLRDLHAENPAAPAPTLDLGAAFWTACPPQDAYITSFDGLRLHALELPNQPGSGWVILAHGYTSAALHMGAEAARFRAMGYSLLVPDARGHGQSEGGYIGMGWDERRDICGWIAYILDRQPDAAILLYGISMGATTVMIAAGEPLAPNVKGVVEDCGYTSIMDEFSHQLTHSFGMPRIFTAPILFFAELVVRLRAGYSPRAGSAVEQLRKTKLPMLFIHGEQDRYVPFWMLDAVYSAAATEDKQKLAFPGAAHGLSAQSDPQRYWGAVEAFAKRVMR